MSPELRAKAKKLLDLVVSELRRRGAVVVIGKASRIGEIGRAGDGLLNVNGLDVPIRFREEVKIRRMSVYHHRSNGTGELRVSCEWVWVGMKSHLRSKTFIRYKNGSEESFRFDINKIVDHILLWTTTYAREQARYTNKEECEEQWGRVAERLRSEFPEMTSAISSGPDGVRLFFVVNEKQARDLLSKAKST